VASKSSRVTEPERVRIIELYLDHHSLRQIARILNEENGTARKADTVHRVVKAWREENAAETDEQLAELHAKQVALLERNASDARRLFETSIAAKQLAPATGALQQEMRALERLSKLTGTEQPVKVQHSGQIDTTAPLDKLSAALDQIAPDDDTDEDGDD